MTEYTTKKAKIEALLGEGKKATEIAEILGVTRRYVIAVAWRVRNSGHEKAIKRAVRERLRADPEWLNKERERRRKRHKERRKNRAYRAGIAHSRRRWRLRARAEAQKNERRRS